MHQRRLRGHGVGSRQRIRTIGGRIALARPQGDASTPQSIRQLDVRDFATLVYGCTPGRCAIMEAAMVSGQHRTPTAHGTSRPPRSGLRGGGCPLRSGHVRILAAACARPTAVLPPVSIYRPSAERREYTLQRRSETGCHGYPAYKAKAGTRTQKEQNPDIYPHPVRGRKKQEVRGNYPSERVGCAYMEDRPCTGLFFSFLSFFSFLFFSFLFFSFILVSFLSFLFFSFLSFLFFSLYPGFPFGPDANYYYCRPRAAPKYWGVDSCCSCWVFLVCFCSCSASPLRPRGSK